MWWKENEPKRWMQHFWHNLWNRQSEWMWNSIIIWQWPVQWPCDQKKKKKKCCREDSMFENRSITLHLWKYIPIHVLIWLFQQPCEMQGEDFLQSEFQEAQRGDMSYSRPSSWSLSLLLSFCPGLLWRGTLSAVFHLYISKQGHAFPRKRAEPENKVNSQRLLEL